MQGLTIKETAQELGVSTRTVIRMMEDGRLQADKVMLPDGGRYMWMVHPLSVARIQVKRELEQAFKNIKVDKRTREVLDEHLRTD